MSERVARIEACLRAALNPAQLEVIDDSDRHAGHVGARGGAGHFRVRILSARFRGLPMLARHRLVYAALGELLPDQIHALGIEADAPDERTSSPDSVSRTPEGSR